MELKSSIIKLFDKKYYDFDKIQCFMIKVVIELFNSE